MRRFAVSALTLAVLGGLAVPLAVPLASPAAAAVGAPSLHQLGVQAANPVLTWDPVPGATGYRVQVDDSANFAAPEYSETTNALHATPSVQLPRGILHWRVAAVDNAGTGAFAESTFELTWGKKPTPLAPADGAELVFPSQSAVFRWDPLPGATRYLVEVDDDEGFVAAGQYTTTNTTLALTTPQSADQVYYWRVQAQFGYNGSSGTSAWSDTRSYRFQWLRTAEPTAPPDTTLSAITDVTLEWKPVPGAQAYNLEISPNGDWANNNTDRRRIYSTRYTPTTPLPNGSYFWRVQPIDAANHLGNWNDPWVFTRGWPAVPEPLTPAWSAATPANVPIVSTVPEFSWTPVEHASRYQLQISKDPNFSTIFGECFTNHTSWTMYRSSSGTNDSGSCTIDQSSYIWATGVVHYWRVRGIDSAGSTLDSTGKITPGEILGLWSDSSAGPARFIPSPTIPVQLGPDDKATVVTPTLTWGEVADADYYRVSVKSSNTNSVVATATTYATSWTPPSTLRASDGPFVWSVLSVNGAGQVSAGTSRSFSLSTATATATSPEPTAPDDKASSQRMPMMAWTPVVNATRYVVRYSVNGFEQPELATGLPFAAFTYTSLPLPVGTYTWWVDAYASNGTRLATGSQRTFTITQPNLLGTADYLTPQHCSLVEPCVSEPDTPRFSWTGEPGSSTYKVTVAADKNFTTVLRTYVTPATTLTPRDSLVDSQAGQAFYWFVRPCLDSGTTTCGPGPDTSSALATARAFRKRSEPVQLIGPEHNAEVADQVTFSWRDYLDTQGDVDPFDADTAQQPTQEAKQYRIQVSTVSDFTSTLDTQVVNAKRYTPSTLTYPEGPLFWRVQAIDASGNNLTWSEAVDVAAPTPHKEVRLATKQSPAPVHLAPDVPISPGNAKDDLDQIPALTWTPRDFAAQYDVELYANADTRFTAGNRVRNATTKFAAWAPTDGLPQGDYAWRVRTVDGTGGKGRWSDPATFTLGPDAPGGLSPEDGLRTNSADLLFSWSPVATAAQYRWQLSRNPGFGSPTSQLTVMTAWAPLYPLTDDTYSWRVQALDSSNNVISTSDTFTLTRDGTAPRVTANAPTSDALLTGALSVTFSEPVTGISPTSLALTVTGTSTPVAATTSPGPTAVTTTATVTPASPLVPGLTYRVSVGSAIADTFGNLVTPFSWDVRATTSVENDSPAMREYWDRDRSSAAGGSAYDTSNAAGSSATFAFTGTKVSLVGTRMKTGGYAKVLLDGAVRTSTASFYSPTTRYRQTVWTASGLSSGQHTVQVIVLGTKPRGSTGAYVSIDAFMVGSVWHQESELRESFARSRTSQASGGSFDRVTHTRDTDAGPSFQLRFRGTSVTVYATRTTSSGSGTITVDGGHRQAPSLKGSTYYRYPLATVSGLTDGLHTLVFQPSGTASISLDYVTVS